MNNNSKEISPLFQWAGGKRKLWKHYKDILKKENIHTTYVEPFFGGGAVFCEIANQFENLIINDINGEIIGIYNTIKYNVDEFLDNLECYSSEYLKLKTKEERKEYYYNLRKEYWLNPNSTLLYFLMRLSFNGVWQSCTEAKGLFGTPAGLLNQTKKEQIFNRENILNWNKVLQKTKILNTSYENISIPDNSLVFLDPPYRDSFTTYSTDFSDKEQVELIEWAKEKQKVVNNVTIFESNRCVENDTFFEDLIPNGTFTYIDVTYTAGRRKKTDNGFEAKKAREFLVKF